MENGPTVKVFSAGDCQTEDVGELIELLLNRSGYTKVYEWECRVDRQMSCEGECRPIRVIGYKSYGVILRVKPTAYATIDYQMTLHVPQGSGYSSKNLYEQLRVNEKSISRLARKQEKEVIVDTITTPPTPSSNLLFPKPDTDNEYRPEFKTLQGVLKNTDKLKYILQKVIIVNGFNFCKNRIQFTETLRHECRWDKEPHTKNAIGRVMSELVKNDYLMEVVNDRDAIIGYTLTEKGNFFLTQNKDSKPTTIPAPNPIKKEVKEEIKVDIPALLINMRGKLQELADVANKIAANNSQKAELLQKIQDLDHENEELSKVLHNNKESQEALNRLGHLIVPLPIQGMRHA